MRKTRAFRRINHRTNHKYTSSDYTHTILSFSITYKKLALSLCGDGRTRTAVQTPHQAAFYTLSLSLVVGGGLPKDRPPSAYPLNLGQLQRSRLLHPVWMIPRIQDITGIKP